MIDPTSNFDAKTTNDLASMMAGYRSIIDMAESVSELASPSLRVQAFHEVLRHMLENERMTFMFAMKQEQQNGRARANLVEIPR
ncbi:MAG: hypothetical protein ACRD2E_08885 [Terriglobales bacterium]